MKRAIAVILLSLLATPMQAQSHALDPLSAAEITRAVSLLQSAGRSTSETRFGTITVQPQEKSALNARAARVVGFDWSRNEGFVAVVDLAGGRVASFTVVDSEPPMRLIIIRRAEEIAHADPRWIAAMQSRHIDTSRVSILVGMPERARLQRDGADRIANGIVWLRDGVPNAMTVKGLRIVANLTKGKLTTFEDNGTPLSSADSFLVTALAKPRATARATAHRAACGIIHQGEWKRDHVGQVEAPRRHRPALWPRDS
jgi:Cu2+-containing amine oxidase